jgi:hypothetical protein
MTHPKMERTANVLLVVRDNDFLKRSKHGVIWGTLSVCQSTARELRIGSHTAPLQWTPQSL